MDVEEILEAFKFLKNPKTFFSFTDEPKLPYYICNYDSPNGMLNSGGASVSLNKKDAKLKATYEAIERYYSEFRPEYDFLHDSFQHLSKRYDVVDPKAFVNTSNLRQDSGYIKSIRESPLNWIKGEHFLTKSPVYIPAQLTFWHYPVYNEPLIRTPISTGTALGSSLSSAVQNGIFETIERDSFMLHWLKYKTPTELKLNEKNELFELKTYFSRYLLNVKLFDITSDLGVPTVMALLLDNTGMGPFISVGVKTSETYQIAAQGAMLESLQVRLFTRYSYLLDGQPQVSSAKEIIDAKTRAYYWYQPQNISDLNFILKKAKEKDIDEYNHISVDLIKIIKKHRLDFFTVDLSKQELTNFGYHCVKSLSPQLHPLNLSESDNYDFSERLLKLNGNKINRTPHPF